MIRFGSEFATGTKIPKTNRLEEKIPETVARV